MAKFRKKPVVIEATQWHKPGDHREVVRMLSTPEGYERWSDDMARAFGQYASEFYAVPTLEGVMRVTPGDWIITGVQGEHYPCKPDIFAATYEAVDQ